MRRERRRDAAPVAESAATRLVPLLGVGLATLAAAIWYVRPQETLVPLALIGVAWVLRWAVFGAPTRLTSLDLPLVIFLVSAYAAAGTGFNQDPHWAEGISPLFWAWGKYWTVVAAVALFYAIANLRDRNEVRLFVAGFALLGATVAVYFILTNDWSHALKNDLLAQVGAWISEPAPEISGRRLHPNVAGGIAAFALPFSLAWLWADRHRPVALGFWLIICGVTLSGIVLSASRGAWFALAGVLSLWALARGIAAVAQGRRLLRIALIGIAAVAVIAVAAAALDRGAFGGIAVTPGAGNAGTSSVLGRLALWQSALSLAQDYFYTGSGLGTMPLTLSTYGLMVPVFYVPHAHNVLLNIAVEQGIVGLAAFVWVLAATVWLAIRHLGGGAATGRRSSLLVEAAIASLGVLLLHGMVDDVPYGSRALALLFVPSAVVVAATAGDARSREVPIPRLAIIAGTAVLVLAGLWQVGRLTGAWYANVGALAQARAELTTYSSPDRLPELVRRTANLDDATAQYGLALTYDGGNRTAHERLALIALSRAEYDAALRHAEEARRQAPQLDATRILLADSLLAAGRLDDAYALWRLVPDAAERLELTAALRYDKLNDRPRAQAARALAERLRGERPPGH